MTQQLHCDGLVVFWPFSRPTSMSEIVNKVLDCKQAVQCLTFHQKLRHSHNEIKSSPYLPSLRRKLGRLEPGFDHPFGGLISDSPPNQWVTNITLCMD